MTESEILAELKQVIDAEVGVNIVDLGLVYKVEFIPDGVRVLMTMTTQSCPMGDLMTRQAEEAIRAKFPNLKDVKIELTWEPAWSPSMMSPSAKKQMGTA
ncbi:MAG: metal-sulfur cluster assembly factor [Nitrospinae bacterium]|nr:metal-sulfur cluster assembly factor [Nitrospinota bacterium]